MCLWCKSGSSRDVFVPCKEGEQGEMMVVPVMLSAFHATSSIRIYIPKDLKHKDPRQLVRKAILETKKRFPDDIPLVDPVDHQGIRDDTFKKLIKAWTCTIS
jgi:ATP-dependent RNA helicase DOB1